MTVWVFETKCEVARHEGLVMIGGHDGKEMQGIGLYPAEALRVARELVAAVSEVVEVPSFVGLVDGITISPPEGEAPGRMVIKVADTTLALLFTWPDLIEFANTARQALMAAPPEGLAH